MWIFILFIIGAFFLFFFAIRADNKRKEGVHRKKYNNPNNPQLLSNQVDERLGISNRTKPNEKISEPNGNKKKKLRKQNRRLDTCGTRSAVDPIGRNGRSNTYTSPSETDPSPNSSGYMTRKQLSYYSNYLKDELFTDYLLAASDSSLIKISEQQFKAMLKEKTDSERLSRTFSETANNNNIGIAFEKSGNIDNAIEAYERNLDIAYPALHSYERLMILYRKEKRYNDEIRVIEKAINVFPIKSHKVYIDKWKDRLTKAKLKSK